MPFFKNVFKSKDGSRAASKAGKYGDNAEPVAQPKPRWEESWSRKEVAPEEIQELIHVCTQEMKSRGTQALYDAFRRVAANAQQPWTCPLYCSPSAPRPTPAPRATLCAASSRPTTKEPGNSRARAWPPSCA
jgi:hypothetical protein